MTLTVNQIELSFPGAYWIPVKFREQVLAAYKAEGIKIRLRYRGPRDCNRVMVGKDGSTYYRGRIAARQDCLMDEATHFTVYRR